MKILLLCYEHPSPSIAGSYRVLYSLKYLSEKYGHDITLISFRLPGKEYPDLSSYCRLETIDIPCRTGLKSPHAILYSLRNLFSPHSIFSRHPSFLNYSYSPKMERKVKALLDNNRFDILVVDHPIMLRYISSKKGPIVLLETFAISEIAGMEYKLERSRLRKIARLLYYYQTRNYAEIYRVVDVSIAVTSHQRDRVKQYYPNLDIEIVPFGVDTEYFRPAAPETEFPSLIIHGGITSLLSKREALYYYNKVYPLIKAQVPHVRLYIVGDNPPEEILRLGEDSSIVVTGHVNDLNSYLSRAWVVVGYLQENFGVRVRVLQAMAAGKSIVTTSMAIPGIDVSPGQDIIIADSPTEFAERVIELLNNKQLREKIGHNARNLMEKEYSWENVTDKLNKIFQKVIDEK